MDRDWWQTYNDEVNIAFFGERFSNNAHPSKFRTTRIATKCYANSGAGCIVTAIMGGAKRIILLGFDCQFTGGQSHWHGDHPKNLGNAARIEKWGAKFAELRRDYHKIEILNASRETALTCFERVDLESVL